MPRLQRTVIGLDGCATHCDAPGSTVDPIRARLPEPDARRRSADLFRLLGDPTRVSILLALLEGGELCVCDISLSIDVSENVVSQALRLLRTADIVRSRRDGRRIYYRLADAHVRLLLDLSAEHLGHTSEPAAPAAKPAPRRARSSRAR